MDTESTGIHSTVATSHENGARSLRRLRWNKTSRTAYPPASPNLTISCGVDIFGTFLHGARRSRRGENNRGIALS